MNPTQISDASYKRYLASFGLVVTGLLLLVLLTNYLVDPYLNHQWDSPLLQRLRPTQEKLVPWGKTYAVFKYKPQVLYVGNSRIHSGLPADPALFDGKRVFNGGIPGASLGDTIAMLQHARSITTLDAVVWGVDYWSFSADIGNSDFDRDLVATGKSYTVRRPLLDLKRALSFDITVDSVDVIFRRTPTVCRSSLAFQGLRDDACNVANLLDRGGVNKALVADIRAIKNKNEKIDQALPVFQVELEQLCKAGIRTMVYINPLHAITLEYFFQRGNWNEFERWKRLLVNSIDHTRQSGCNVQLFDFSGFNSVTSETIPQVSGSPAMENYWEGSHYRTVVGRQILAKMIPLPSVRVPADFGTKLDQDNIEAHLALVRSERERYRTEHKNEIILLNQWFGKHH